MIRNKAAEGGGPFEGPQAGSSRMRRGGPSRQSPTPGHLLCSPLLLLLLLTAACTVVNASDPPQFVERPQDQTVKNDRVASFTCRAVGNPEPRIQWRKNGRRVNGNTRYIVLDVQGGSILRIEPVKYQRDEATYECVAENPAGDTIKAEAKLEVISDDPNSEPSGFPYFRTEPKTKAVEIDHTALLVCDARGNPDPEITWYKDNKPVDSKNPRYSVLRSGSLQISTSTEEDGGKYECVAKNSVGTAFSNLVSLYVRVRRVPPRFSKAPEPVYEVMPGESLTIPCVAVGSPMPYVQWKKGPSVDMTENTITKNVLMLENIQESANYTCQAQSTLGLVTKDVAVVVQALPRPPSTVRISDVTPTSVRITWNYEQSPGEISYYVIQYKPRHADRDYAEISGLVTKFYTVIGLTPFTEYEFHVLAVNKIGRGAASDPVLVTTGETGSWMMTPLLSLPSSTTSMPPEQHTTMDTVDTTATQPLRLTHFTPNYAKVWFFRAEVQFWLRNITSPTKKAALILESLPDDILHRHSTWLGSFPGSISYDTLKEKLISSDTPHLLPSSSATAMTPELSTTMDIVDTAAPSQPFQLPPFTPNDAETWFLRAEVQFRVHGITSSTNKADLVLEKLPDDAFHLLSTWLRSFPDTVPYDTLKQKLTKAYSLDPAARAARILGSIGCPIRDDNPSAIYNELLDLATHPATDLSDKRMLHILREVLISRLSEPIVIAIPEASVMPVHEFIKNVDIMDAAVSQGFSVTASTGSAVDTPHNDDHAAEM